MRQHSPLLKNESTVRLKKYVVGVGLCALLGGLTACATSLPEHDMPPSFAVDVPAQGLLSTYMRQQPADDLTMSGFHLLARGVDALSARLQLIDTAQTSLDLQYYIYSGDVTGGLIADRLLAAADRGVRVRILLDDIGNSMSDRAVGTLDRHTNIEVRLFNPVSVRNEWFKLPSKVVEFGRINNRMHNKLLVADNLAMITGGRNIGDEYYALSERDFQDIDLLGIGPISREASASFDAFWNNPHAIPASVLYKNAKQGTLNRMRRGLASHREVQAQRPYIKAMEKESFGRDLAAGRLKLYWGRSDWLADPPVKADAQSALNEVPVLARILANHLRDVQSELLIKSAYLIPGDNGVELLGGVVEQGAVVSMLTNSLATTDVLAVHSSYATYRVPMLKKGIRLWELRPMAAKQERPNTFIGDSVASLHAKSFVFDRYKLFVGSINLDPRSITLNTEAGVMVYQKELAIRLAELFERWTADDYAYELRLEEGDRLQWHAEGEQWDSEPEASRTRRFRSWMLNWLPIEDQL